MVLDCKHGLLVLMIGLACINSKLAKPGTVCGRHPCAELRWKLPRRPGYTALRHSIHLGVATSSRRRSSLPRRKQARYHYRCQVGLKFSVTVAPRLSELCTGGSYKVNLYLSYIYEHRTFIRQPDEYQFKVS